MPFDQHWLLACVAPRALLGPRLGYYRRGGRHGLSAYDWAWALDFADGCDQTLSPPLMRE